MSDFGVTYTLDDDTTEGWPAEDATTETGRNAIISHVNDALDLDPKVINITKVTS